MAKTSPDRAIVAAASIGNFGEIYDFAIFGFSVPVMSKHFFPATDPTAALLSMFAVYAAAFFARPLGGLVFGVLADKIGRVRVLAFTILLMAAGTALIGLLPTYAIVGIAAPVLLVACRILQGLAMGGETTGSTAYVLEAAPASMRGRWIGIIWFFANLPNVLVGVLLAALQFGVGADAYSDWVWRIPFLLGGLVGVVGAWLRRNLDDTEEFKEASRRARVKNPLRAMSRSGLRGMLDCALVQPAQSVGAYLVLGFMYTFLVKQVKLDPTAALLSNAAAILAYTVIIPVGGVLSDRYGRKPVMTVGALWIAATSYPAVQLAASGSLMNAYLGQIIVALGVGFYGGASWPAAAEFFPTSFRATGHAISYQLLVAIFGGATPFVAAWLVAATGSPLAPGLYVALIAALGVIAVQFVPETKGISLRTSIRGTQPSAERAAIEDFA